jgi:hypothetical protein
MALTASEPAVRVRLFVAAKDVLRDNVAGAPEQAPPCWGVFLVEKRAGGASAHPAVRTHLIEVFCYQEDAGEYPEDGCRAGD